MASVKPKKLKKGDTIALVAPSSWCAPEDSQNTKAELEKLGYVVYVHEQCNARDHMSAGTPEQKVAALHDVFSNPDIDAVFCLRGGYQTLNIIDRLDYELIKKNPKILIGYSDITALHMTMLHRSDLVSFHGTNGRSFGSLSEDDPELISENKNSLEALEFLSGNVPDNLFHDYPVKIIQPGVASGKLIGGNMQLLCSMLEAGSKYCPPLDKKILIIEDIGEEITKIERQFSAWRLRGIFKNVAGLIIGHMTDIKDTPGRAGSFVYDMEAIIRRHTYEVAGPVIMNAPFGHALPNYIFPQGVMAELSAEKGVSVLKLLESPFSDA